MTGREHYKHAQSWLFKADHADARGSGETAESCAAIAQVHATLALAAATVDLFALYGQTEEDATKEASRRAVTS